MCFVFLEALTERMKAEGEEGREGGIVLWYDSVVSDTGELEWQNGLTRRNERFFHACDGIFTRQHSAPAPPPLLLPHSCSSFLPSTAAGNPVQTLLTPPSPPSSASSSSSSYSSSSSPFSSSKARLGKEGCGRDVFLFFVWKKCK